MINYDVPPIRLFDQCYREAQELHRELAERWRVMLEWFGYTPEMYNDYDGAIVADVSWTIVEGALHIRAEKPGVYTVSGEVKRREGWVSVPVFWASTHNWHFIVLPEYNEGL